MGYGNLEIKRRMVKQEVSTQFEREEQARKLLASRKGLKSRDKLNSSKNLHSAGWAEEFDHFGPMKSSSGINKMNVRRNKEIGDQRNNRPEYSDTQNVVFHSSNRAGSQNLKSSLRRSVAADEEGNSGVVKFQEKPAFRGNASQLASPFKSPVNLKYEEEKSKNNSSSPYNDHLRTISEDEALDALSEFTRNKESNLNIFEFKDALEM